MRKPTATNHAYKIIFQHLVEEYCDELEIKNYSPRTIILKREILRRFTNWCFKKRIVNFTQVTENDIENYQKHLHYHSKVGGGNLSVTTQRTQLSGVKNFFRWLSNSNHLAISPAEKLILPTIKDSLPGQILSKSEAQTVLEVPNSENPYGLRDRAILETLYNTGLRRLELINLEVRDCNFNDGVILIRAGKGNKDRVVPIGKRAIYWIREYLSKSRKKLLRRKRSKNVFVSMYGRKLSTSRLTAICHMYIRDAKINKEGSCHIFRHSTATHMLENGADIRVIQSMLGHSSISTTQIYTRVSIQHLKEVHESTHSDY